MIKYLFIAVFSLCLTGCGVKPGSVKSDPPRTYPDIQIDPAPHGGVR